MRRGDDMHGRGGTEGYAASRFGGRIPALTHSSSFTEGDVPSGRSAPVSSLWALCERPTNRRHPHWQEPMRGRAWPRSPAAQRYELHVTPTSAPRSSRGTGASAGETSKFIGTARPSRVSIAWRESGGSPQAL